MAASISQSQPGGRRIEINVTDLRMSTWKNIAKEDPHQTDFTLKDVIISGSDSTSFSKLKEKIASRLKLKGTSNQFDVANLTGRRITAENVGQLGNEDSLVLLDENQEEFPVTFQHKFSNVPHTRSLTNQEGKFHGTEEHNAAAFALAELVDNSLAATAANDGERRIEIHFYDDKTSPSLHILDNGHGMNSETLQLGLKYKAPKDERRSQFSDPTSAPASDKDSNFDENEEVHPIYINSNISKFGAGLKQAVFFLGDLARIITKQAAMTNVCEVVLSSREMEEMELQENENAWLVTQYIGGVGVIRDSTASSRVQNLIRTRENTSPSFTHVIVQSLKSPVLELLRRKDLDQGNKNPSVEKQLSHIYHYYLHGMKERPTQNVSISLHRYNLRGMTTINLRELKDLETCFVDSAAPKPFLFTIEVESFNRTQDIVEHKIGGIIRYHPFLHDHETKPGGIGRKEDLGCDLPEVLTDEIDETRSIRLGPQAQCTSEDAVRKSGEFFHIWWNGRLIPHTRLKSFDWCSPADKMRVTDKLYKPYGRISGSLFFNSSVIHITDNKLNLTATADLYEMFNEKAIGTKASVFKRVEQSGTLLKAKRMSKGAKKNFVDWLKECQKYDKQVIYKKPLDQEMARLLPAPSTHFKRYGSATWDNMKFSVGDVVKLHNIGNQPQQVLGRIICFNVPSRHCLSVDSVSPSPSGVSMSILDRVVAPLSTFVLQLIPRSYYNGENGGIRTKEMRLIDKDMTRSMVDEVIQAQTADLKAMKLTIEQWGVNGKGPLLEDGAKVPLDDVLIKMVAFGIVNAAGDSLNGVLPNFETQKSKKSIHMVARVHRLSSDGSRTLHYTSNFCNYLPQYKGFCFKGLDLKQMFITAPGNFVITFRSYIDLVNPDNGNGAATSATSASSPRSTGPGKSKGRRRTSSGGIVEINPGRSVSGGDNSRPIDPEYRKEWIMDVDSIGRKILLDGEPRIRMPFHEIYFSVVAGTPDYLTIDKFGEEEETSIEIGKPFVVEMSLKDAHENVTVPRYSLDSISQTLTITATSKKFRQLELQFTHKNLVSIGDRLVIENVVAVGYLLGDEYKECRVEVQIKIGKKTLKTSHQIQIRYGRPVKLEADGPLPFEDGSQPAIQCRVLDSWGNLIPCTEGNMKPILLQCNIYKEGEDEIFCSRNVLATTASNSDAQLMDEGIDLPELKSGQCQSLALRCELSYPGIPPLPVTLTAIPSTRPEMIRLYLGHGDDLKQEIQNGAEMTRKINELLDLTFKIFDGQGNIVPFDRERHKMKVTWSDEPRPVGRKGDNLPKFVVPSRVVKNKEFVTTLKISGFKRKVTHSFHLTSTPLQAHAIKGYFTCGSAQNGLFPRDQELNVPIGENLPNIILKLMDAYDNVLTDLDENDRSQLEITGGPFGVSYEENLSEPPPPLVGDCSFLISIRVNNPALGRVSLTLNYASFTDILPFNLIPGIPVALAFEINGLLVQKPRETISVSNASCLPVSVFLLDAFQNKTRAREEVEVSLNFRPDNEWAPPKTGRPTRQRLRGERVDFGLITVTAATSTPQCPMNVNPCPGKCFGKSKFIRVEAKLEGKAVSSIIHFHVTARPATPHALVVNANLLEGEELSYVAESLFHNLAVMLEGEDGTPIVAAEKDQLVLQATNLEPNGDNVVVALPAVNVQEGVYTFGDVPSKAGTYSMEFIYTNRDGLTLSKKFSQTLRIIPGKPASLRPVQEVTNLFVSNDPESPESRVIVQNLELSLRDQFGNICTPTGIGKDSRLNGDVAIIFLHKEDFNADMDLLENPELLSTAFPLTEGSVVIPPLIVQANLNLGNITKHTLQFAATMTNNKTDGAALKFTYELEFTFFNDVQVRKEIRHHVSRIESLTQTIKSKEQAIAKFTTERNNLLQRSELFKRIEVEKRAALAQLDLAPGATIQNLTDVRKVEERILVLETLRGTSSSQSQGGESNIQRGPWSEEEHVLGTVGLLTRVKHDAGSQIQRVLSWHLQSNLTVVVVEKEQVGHELGAKYPGQRFMLLDILGRGWVHNWNESNVADVLSGLGNPVYARFLLELDVGPGNEMRRLAIQKVFDKLISNLIVVDTLPDATRFMKQWNSSKSRGCPTILTRDGGRLSSLGIIGGDSGSAPELHQLKYRLGLAPNPGIRRIQRELDVLPELKGVIVERENSLRTLEVFDGSYKRKEWDGLQREVQELRVELDRMKIELQRLRCDGTGRSATNQETDGAAGSRSRLRPRPKSTPTPQGVNGHGKRARMH